MAPNPWTEPAVKAMMKMYHDGVSMSEISRQLNKTGHAAVTRNAVIGKLHRMGYKRGKPTMPESKVKRPPLKSRPIERTNHNPVPRRKFTDIIARERKVAAERKRLSPRERIGDAPLISIQEVSASTCRWPIGDVGEPGFGFCGRPVKAGSSYCAEHACMSVSKQQGRRKGRRVSQTDLDLDLVEARRAKYILRASRQGLQSGALCV